MGPTATGHWQPIRVSIHAKAAIVRSLEQPFDLIKRRNLTYFLTWKVKRTAFSWLPIVLKNRWSIIIFIREAQIPFSRAVR